LIAIILGILLGEFAPMFINRIVVTISGLFGSFLLFVIPLLILSFVTMGIADLTQGVGKLLGFSAILAYVSTVTTGMIAYLIASDIFPRFVITHKFYEHGEETLETVAAYFTFPIPPIMTVPSALVLAFIFGICISMRKGTDVGKFLYGLSHDLSEVINMVLHGMIIPLLPIFICGTFVSLTVSGETYALLNVLWKVFLTVICLHIVYLFVVYFIAGLISGKPFLKMMKNQIPGYLSAFGTQSSAATIPVNLQCAEANGIPKEIRNFVIPLFANIHMPGSMTTITCCTTAVLLMYGMDYDIKIMFGFIATLGIVMMASPGAPGGSIMSALPFLPLVGIHSDGALASILISLYITQDSFGTACNVSGDNALAAIIDKVNNKFIKKIKDDAPVGVLDKS
jgi:Na+/H+-dicarboxylate symporter